MFPQNSSFQKPPPPPFPVSGLESLGIPSTLTAQIIHRHPDNEYVKRTEFINEEMVIEHYPIILANRILNFVEKAPPNGQANNINTPIVQAAKTGNNPERVVKKEEKGQAPSRQGPVERLFGSRSPMLPPSAQVMQAPVSNVVEMSPHTTRMLPDRSRYSHSVASVTAKGSPIQKARNLPDPGMPSPKTSTSQSKPSIVIIEIPDSPSPEPMTLPSRSSSSQSSASEQFARKSSNLKPTTATRSPFTPEMVSSPESNPPTPKLVTFEPMYTSRINNIQRPTIILRHRVGLRALKDVFTWCLKSAQEGHVMSPEGWLIKDQDRRRVQDLLEISTILGLERLRQECFKSIAKLDDLNSSFYRRPTQLAPQKRKLSPQSIDGDFGSGNTYKKPAPPAPPAPPAGTVNPAMLTLPAMPSAVTGVEFRRSRSDIDMQPPTIPATPVQSVRGRPNSDTETIWLSS